MSTTHLFLTADLAATDADRTSWYAAVAAACPTWRAYDPAEWEFARIGGASPALAIDWVTAVPTVAELLDVVR